jgi:hypothetical protein
MTTRSGAASLALLVAPFFLLADCRQSSAEGFGLFCPVTVFCKPRHPIVWYRCICPQKVCPCCGLDNFGYYPVCWQPWPFPPNYGHCPVPPAAAYALPPNVTKSTNSPPPTTTPEELPSPSTMPKGSSSQKSVEGRMNTCSCFHSVSR